MHARSGGNIEVMGLMQGKVHEDTMIIMDVFALPVEGTETRVNAQAEAYEYMVTYMENARAVNDKKESRQGIGPFTEGHTGGSIRECDWLVPFTSGLRLLALWHWCQHTNAQPAISRTLGCSRGKLQSILVRIIRKLKRGKTKTGRPEQNHVSRQSRDRSVPYIPQGL